MLVNKSGLLCKAAVLVLLSIVILSGCSGRGSETDTTGNKTSAPDRPAVQVDKEKAKTASGEAGDEKIVGGLVQATVTSVVDGDTFHVILENGKKEKVRLIGVDTPETSGQVEPYGKEASQYTKKRLLKRKIWLELDVEERDRYGRLLAYVWLESPGERKKDEARIRAGMYNAELLLKGYAQVMTVPPNVKYVDYFTEYQREARDDNRGLWGLDQGTQEEYYLASSKSKKFHRPDCRWAQEIHDKNLVKFNTVDDALDKGYQPCRWCNP